MPLGGLLGRAEEPDRQRVDLTQERHTVHAAEAAGEDGPARVGQVVDDADGGGHTAPRAGVPCSWFASCRPRSLSVNSFPAALARWSNSRRANATSSQLMAWRSAMISRASGVRTSPSRSQRYTFRLVW